MFIIGVYYLTVWLLELIYAYTPEFDFASPPELEFYLPNIEELSKATIC